jgi:hypothetical protein
MRVQIIYGEHTKADFACRACYGAGNAPGVVLRTCWACHGRGNTVADQRTYTYEAPDGTQLWDVLITPTPQQGGRRGTVVKLGSDYDGPVKQAYPIPRPEFPCMGECGAVLAGDGRNRMPVLCAGCTAILPEEIRARLECATGSAVFAAMAEIRIFLSAYRAGREDESSERDHPYGILDPR